MLCIVHLDQLAHTPPVFLPQVQATFPHILFIVAAVEGDILLLQVDMMPYIAHVKLVTSYQVGPQLQGNPLPDSRHEGQLQGKVGRQVEEGIQVQVHLVGRDWDGGVFQPPRLSPSGEEYGEITIKEVAEAYKFGVGHVQVLGDPGVRRRSVAVLIVIINLLKILERWVIRFFRVGKAVHMVLGGR